VIADENDVLLAGNVQGFVYVTVVLDPVIVVVQEVDPSGVPLVDPVGHGAVVILERKDLPEGRNHRSFLWHIYAFCVDVTRWGVGGESGFAPEFEPKRRLGRCEAD